MHHLTNILLQCQSQELEEQTKKKKKNIFIDQLSASL